MISLALYVSLFVQYFDEKHGMFILYNIAASFITDIVWVGVYYEVWKEGRNEWSLWNVILKNMWNYEGDRDIYSKS